MNILQKLLHELTSFPPVTDATKKQLTNDAVDLAMNYGPMALSIKTPIAKTYDPQIAQYYKEGLLSPKEINTPDVWKEFKQWAAPTGMGNNSRIILGEIPDEAAKANKNWVNDWFDNFRKLKLPGVLDHPELYNEYPFLRNIDIVQTMNGYGHYAPKDNQIALNPMMNNNQLLDTLLHESQHAIQHRSNMPKMMRGSNSQAIYDTFMDMPKVYANVYKTGYLNSLEDYVMKRVKQVGSDDTNLLKVADRYDGMLPGGIFDPAKFAFDYYKANPGEVLARMPYQRLGKTAEHPLQTAVKMGYPIQTWAKYQY